MPRHYDIVSAVLPGTWLLDDDATGSSVFFGGAPGSSELREDTEDDSSSSEDSTDVSNATAPALAFSASTWKQEVRIRRLALYEYEEHVPLKDLQLRQVKYHCLEPS